MIKCLRPEDLAEILELARKRDGLVAPEGRVERPRTPEECSGGNSLRPSVRALLPFRWRPSTSCWQWPG